VQRKKEGESSKTMGSKEVLFRIGIMTTWDELQGLGGNYDRQ